MSSDGRRDRVDDEQDVTRALLARCRQTGPSRSEGLLHAQAQQEVHRLARCAQNPLAASSVVPAVLGQFHSGRYECDPEEERGADALTAVALLSAVHDHDPSLVPHRLRAVVEEWKQEHSGTALERWHEVGVMLVERYVWYGGPLALDDGLTLLWLCLRAIPADDPRHATCLSTVADALRLRHQVSGDMSDLRHALETARLAVAAGLLPDGTPRPDTPERPVRADFVTRLGTLRDVLLACTAARDDAPGPLAEALQVGETILSLVPRLTGPVRPDLYAHHALALRLRFEAAGERRDIDRAVDYAIQAVEAAQVFPDAPAENVAQTRTGLVGVLLARFEHFGDPQDLNRAVEAARLALDDFPDRSPGQATLLSNLAVAYQDRYRRTGAQQDGDQAVAFGLKAVEATPDTSFEAAAFRMNLGNTYAIRHEWTTRRADLDDAVGAYREALTLAHGEPALHSMILSSLADALDTRFSDTQDEADLREAIDLATQAIDEAPDRHPERARLMGRLGNIYRTRYRETDDLHALDQAATWLSRGVEATPENATDRGGRLTDLAAVLRRRYERTGQAEDLTAAVDAGRSAVAILERLDPQHSDLPSIRSEHGASLAARFELKHRTDDLEEAQQTQRQALAAQPSGHPDRGITLMRLGSLAFTRYKQSADLGDLREMADWMRQAAESASWSADQRVRCAGLWAEAAALAANPHGAADGLAYAVRLLPQLAWPGHPSTGRQTKLAQRAGLASRAAAAALDAGQDQRALELLDQGRSVMWEQTLQVRTAPERVRRRAPHLADRLDALAARLETAEAQSATTRYSDRLQRETLASSLRRTAEEWDRTVAEVNADDQLADIFTPTPFSNLAAAAARGPIVALTAAEARTDALLVHPTGLDVLPLPGVSLTVLADRASELHGWLMAAEASTDERRRLGGKLSDLLEWLWDTCAYPVLEALGHDRAPSPDAPWPRVWWCPTGPFAMLPVHAAGYHDPASGGATVMDRVVSSYTPTLGALLRARSRPAGTAPQTGAIVGVGQKGCPLPGVERELGIVGRYLPGEPLRGANAGRDAVAAAMSRSTWLHLACHAAQNLRQPDTSALHLADGALTLGEIVSARTVGIELAYLSACETASGAPQLADEAIHLAAAMQSCGARHVVATLWEVSDIHAPAVAGDVYRTLASTGRLDSGDTAVAVHRAVRRLRGRRRSQPQHWAPYIHLGP